MALWLWAKGSDEVREFLAASGVELTCDAADVSGADLCCEDKHEALCDGAELSEACARLALQFVQAEATKPTVAPSAEAQKRAVHLWDQSMVASWLRADFGFRVEPPPIDGKQLLLGYEHEQAFEGQTEQLRDALGLQCLAFMDAMADELPERQQAAQQRAKAEQQEMQDRFAEDETDQRLTARRSKSSEHPDAKKASKERSPSKRDDDGGFGDSSIDDEDDDA